MPAECFIGVDQGSSSTKALVLANDGTVRYETRKDLASPLRDGVRVEQDAREILASVREVIDECAVRARDAGLRTAGIGLSCQRSSCLVWDTAAGDPLSPVLSWRDRRGELLVGHIGSSAAVVAERSGLPLTAYYAASKLRWLLENLPAARAAGSVFGTLSSFLSQRLTASSEAKIDHTHAARTQLMNIRSLSWDRELTGLFGLSGIRLPVIVPTVHEFGTIRTSSGPVPLLASVGDQQAALLGLGVLGEGEGGINYGTGGFLMANTGSLLRRVPGLMSSVQYSSPDGIAYLVEGSVNAVGDGLAWIRTHLGLFRGESELEALCRTARTDVVVFLGLNGTGAPHWEQGIESGIRGLAADSTAADIVRGAVEGIAFFMTDIADALRAAGLETTRFTVSGGLSSLAYLVEAQAALLDRPLAVSTAQETSALGAALLAGIGGGAWTASECRRLLPHARAITPLPPGEVRERYRRWRDLHRSLAQAIGR